MIMSPDTPMFGRITIGANRISLGRGGSTALLVRVAEQLRKIRPSDDTVIQIELSRNHLPDATTFDRLARTEQQFAERVITDPTQESPFKGITVGRVAEVMMTPQYEAYEAICEPEKRMTMTRDEILEVVRAYSEIAFDCITHFPKWVE